MAEVERSSGTVAAACGPAIDTATRALAERLSQLIAEIEAAGHPIAAAHAQLAWSMLTGEPLAAPEDSNIDY